MPDTITLSCTEPPLCDREDSVDAPDCTIVAVALALTLGKSTSEYGTCELTLTVRLRFQETALVTPRQPLETCRHVSWVF